MPGFSLADSSPEMVESKQDYEAGTVRAYLVDRFRCLFFVFLFRFFSFILPSIRPALRQGIIRQHTPPRTNPRKPVFSPRWGKRGCKKRDAERTGLCETFPAPIVCVVCATAPPIGMGSYLELDFDVFFAPVSKVKWVTR